MGDFHVQVLVMKRKRFIAAIEPLFLFIAVGSTIERIANPLHQKRGEKKNLVLSSSLFLAFIFAARSFTSLK